MCLDLLPPTADCANPSTNRYREAYQSLRSSHETLVSPLGQRLSVPSTVLRELAHFGSRRQQVMGKKLLLQREVDPSRFEEAKESAFTFGRALFARLHHSFRLALETVIFSRHGQLKFSVANTFLSPA